MLETSFKFHASCRHTHPAADALLQALQENSLTVNQVEHVRARVHAAAIDVLGPVTDPRSIHQSKFSMGFVLALVALYGRAGIEEFTEEALRNPEVRELHDRVEMVLDPEIDAAYPRRWVGLVEVETKDGRRFESRVDVPKGDPGNTLSRAEIEDKARRLAAYGDGSSDEEVRCLIDRAWNLDREPDVRDLLPRS